MKGHPVLWIPGLDHAGIATQAVVERMLRRTRNITRNDMNRAEFERLLWQWKTEKATIINQQLKALGATLDWNREYFTIDEVMCIFYLIIYKKNIYIYFYYDVEFSYLCVIL